MSTNHLPGNREFAFEIFAESFSFSLADELYTQKKARGEIDPPLPGWWKSLGKYLTTDMIFSEVSELWIGTVRDMIVPVTISILDGPSVNDFVEWNHVAEASIEIPSGKIVILGNEYLPDAPRISVHQGIYRTRVYYGGLEQISEDGLEGKDHYHIVLWPTESYKEVKILKRWTSLSLS